MATGLPHFSTVYQYVNYGCKLQQIIM